ncbi:MAG: hypothetical protein JKY52_08540 [Flavobacteriales bacterium]|nr:hypothetical protein [Flavobacteriales bacterium]
MGRPSDYNEEITSRICVRITEGVSLRKICAEDGYPNISTVFRWLDAHKLFQEQYARAREAQGEGFADEIIDIADNTTDDPIRLKLRIDARKWVASKFHGTRYGDKVAVNHGGQADNPIQVTQIELVAPKSDDEG